MSEATVPATEHKEREREPRPPKQQQQKKQKKQKDQSKDSSGGSSGKQGNTTSDESSKQPRQHQRATPKLALFDHLPSKSVERAPSIQNQSDSHIHPAIVKLGGLYKTGSIQDDDDRAYALLVAFHNVIVDYTTPPNKSLTWDLDKHVKMQVLYKFVPLTHLGTHKILSISAMIMCQHFR